MLVPEPREDLLPGDDVHLVAIDLGNSPKAPRHLSLRLTRHLEVCGPCRAAFDAEMRIARRFREGPVPAAPGLWQRIEARIVASEQPIAATDSRPAPPESPAPAASDRARRPLGFSLRSRRAVAAAALLVLAAAGLLYRASSAPTGPHIATVPGDEDSGRLDAGSGSPSAKDPISPCKIQVEIAWPGFDRPAAAARIEVIRDGRAIAALHGPARRFMNSPG